MELSDILEILKHRALEFHRTLAAHNVYHTNVSELEYLQRVYPDISHRAHNVTTSVVSLELTKLSMPVLLIYDLMDVLPAACWDYEFGYANFFEELQTLFRHTAQEFTWSYDHAQSKLLYSLNERTWSLNHLQLNADVDPEAYNEIYQNLYDSLYQRGFILYDATTGDQTGMLILMPAEAATPLADYLINVKDPRGEWLYTGIPEENK